MRMNRTIGQPRGSLLCHDGISLTGPREADERVRQFFRRGAADAERLRNRSCDVDEAGIRGEKAARVEALLFVTNTALSARRLAQLGRLARHPCALGTSRLAQLSAGFANAIRPRRAIAGAFALRRPWRFASVTRNAG